MTPLAWTLLGAAAVFAVCDWWAVARSAKVVEYVCKPATIVALMAVAVALETTNPTRRVWFVAALAFSLAGDVLLMLPRERFLAGLASFLVAHVAYIAGLRAGERGWLGLVVGALVVFPAVAVLGTRVLRGARFAEPRLAVPVATYIAAISVMVAAAVASRNPLAVAGAALFYASDALIGWNRFVRPVEWSPLGIITTYHLGQAALVVSLAV